MQLQQSDHLVSSLRRLKCWAHDIFDEQRFAKQLQDSLQSERDQLSAKYQEISTEREAQQVELEILNEKLTELMAQYHILQQDLASLQAEREPVAVQHKEFSSALQFVQQVLSLSPGKRASRLQYNQICRNCGSHRVATINSAGRVAPFFAARVLGLRGDSSANLFLDAALCVECLFLTHATKFPEESMLKLYEDYRSDTYNSERISFEPDYSLVADLIGGPGEIAARNLEFDKYIEELVREGVIDFGNVSVALDWGGAAGGYAPSRISEACKEIHIFDISNSYPADVDLRRDRIEQDDAYTTRTGLIYDYIQFCHVLEHLQDPFVSVRDMVQDHLRHGGYLYIEVPIEEIMHEFAPSLVLTPGRHYLVHEHINKYCIRSVRALVDSIGGLSILDLREDVTSVGWILPGFNDDGMVRIIRCLCQKDPDLGKS